MYSQKEGASLEKFLNVMYSARTYYSRLEDADEDKRKQLNQRKNCELMPIMVKVEETNPAPNSKCDIRTEWFKNKQKGMRNGNERKSFACWKRF